MKLRLWVEARAKGSGESPPNDMALFVGVDKIDADRRRVKADCRSVLRGSARTCGVGTPTRASGALSGQAIVVVLDAGSRARRARRLRPIPAAACASSSSPPARITHRAGELVFGVRDLICS